MFFGVVFVPFHTHTDIHFILFLKTFPHYYSYSRSFLLLPSRNSPTQNHRSYQQAKKNKNTLFRVVCSDLEILPIQFVPAVLSSYCFLKNIWPQLSKCLPHMMLASVVRIEPRTCRHTCETVFSKKATQNLTKTLTSSLVLPKPSSKQNAVCLTCDKGYGFCSSELQVCSKTISNLTSHLQKEFSISICSSNHRSYLNF